MNEPSAARRDFGLKDIGRALPFILGAAGLVLAFGAISLYTEKGWLLADAHAYWLTGQDAFAGYASAVGDLDAYVYPPPLAQVLSVVTWLPWPIFGVGWVCLLVAVLLWLLRPLGWGWAIVALLWCVPELVLGNIWALIAASVVLALRGHPQAWAFPILTKPVFGIGVLWHVVRREWRPLVLTAATTIGIVLVSVLVDPAMWVSWLHFMGSQSTTGWYAIRVVVATAVVVVAARTDRAWLVPVALLVAAPLVGGMSVLVLLTAIPRLLESPSTIGAPSPPIPPERPPRAAPDS